jgi:hypothetical protein
MPSLRYFIIKHIGCTYESMLLEGYCSWPKLLNTLTIPLLGYPINTLGSITYFLKLGRIFHSPTKTYKQSNSLLGVFNKHHRLNYFGLDY